MRETNGNKMHTQRPSEIPEEDVIDEIDYEEEAKGSVEEISDYEGDEFENLRDTQPIVLESEGETDNN